ncbi:MAG TPA: YgjP-like metallopeptidase domain-containing protein [Candidatus Saccharimonadales bacterium]|nr:YgjP-like metallopeptidase domain-containing protein [Candidatus Saccharimonadales bacterium]
MAFKQFDLTGHTVKIYKRRNSRSLRLSVTHGGDIRVSIPTWAPYSAGVTFAKSRLDWIREQLPVRGDSLNPGQAVGKFHRLQFVPYEGVKPASRVGKTEIIIRYPGHLTIGDTHVQRIAQAACIHALRNQAEQLLPQRLAQLSAQYGYSYTSVSVKQLKSLWGSCDQQKNIVLNLFLMQLPWELIDYVLLHELAHTRVLRHGEPFWSEMEKSRPSAKQLRKAMRDHQPILRSGAPVPMA